MKARGMLLEIDDPIAKQRVFARSPIRMSNTKEVVHKTAPVLGADTDSILKDLLNYDQEMLDELRKDKII